MQSKAIRQRVILAAVVLLHLLLIFMMSRPKTYGPQTYPDQALIMIRLQPEPNKPLPNFDFSPISKQLNSAHNNFSNSEVTIKALEFSETDLSLPKSNEVYSLPQRGSHAYSNIFNPELRKKLQELRPPGATRGKQKYDAWTDIHGQTFIEVGDGKCLMSMPKVDWRDRGTNWGMTTCGKTDSEKMMDNIEQDLEARKHPLDTQP